jgi:hypothetical protein
MKLSESTLTILKNFATINQGIVFKPGNVLRTISGQQNVMARATIAETFDSEFAIYDLNRLLALLGSLKDPDLTIKQGSNTIKISSGGSSATYGICESTMVVAPPDKDLDTKNAKVNFSLSKDDIAQVLKLSSVLALPNIVIKGNRKKITISAVDVKNNDSDDFSIQVGETDAEFKMIFVTENLKMIPGSYDVAMISKGILHFKNQKDPIEYWIATEVGSSYEE